MGEQKEWSFLIWEERKGLLGAAALEYPEPFAALDRYLKAVPRRHVETLGTVMYTLLDLEELKRLSTSPTETYGSDNGFGGLDGS